jgi:hypothetical protein
MMRENSVLPSAPSCMAVRCQALQESDPPFDKCPSVSTAKCEVAEAIFADAVEKGWLRPPLAHLLTDREAVRYPTP